MMKSFLRAKYQMSGRSRGLFRMSWQSVGSYLITSSEEKRSDLSGPISRNFLNGPGWRRKRIKRMGEDFKVIVLPGGLNNTPHSEDLVLVVTLDEFLRMWGRGQALVKNWKLKGINFEPDFAGSFELS